MGKYTIGSISDMFSGTQPLLVYHIQINLPDHSARKADMAHQGGRDPFEDGMMTGNSNININSNR